MTLGTISLVIIYPRTQNKSYIRIIGMQFYWRILFRRKSSKFNRKAIKSTKRWNRGMAFLKKEKKKKTVYYWHHFETGRALVMEIKREIPTISQSLGGLRFDT